MSRGGNDDLAELLGHIDVESYLDREGIDYKLTRGSSGEQLNLRECPVCGGSEWKVYLNADSGLGNCFHGSCESHFNKWSFIRAYLSDSSTGDVFRHIKAVSKEHGWRPKKKAVVVEEDDTELKFPDSVLLPFKGKNITYLASRGINADIAEYFRLRYCADGMFWYKNEGNVRYQSYAKRVIIPIYDIEGNLVSFQGRDIAGDADRKYLFPPGFASTGKFLFNGQNAVGAKSIVLNEGAFDVMATKVALDEDPELRAVVPVGSFGKHLSEGGDNDQVAQLIKLKSMGLREVTFMWDSERSTTLAAIKTALKVSTIGIKARLAVLPEGKDPNEVPPHIVRESYANAVTINKRSAVKLLMGK